MQNIIVIEQERFGSGGCLEGIDSVRFRIDIDRERKFEFRSQFFHRNRIFLVGSDSNEIDTLVGILLVHALRVVE